MPGPPAIARKPPAVRVHVTGQSQGAAPCSHTRTALAAERRQAMKPGRRCAHSQTIDASPAETGAGSVSPTARLSWRRSKATRA